MISVTLGMTLSVKLCSKLLSILIDQQNPLGYNVDNAQGINWLKPINHLVHSLAKFNYRY